MYCFFVVVWWAIFWRCSIIFSLPMSRSWSLVFWKSRLTLVMRNRPVFLYMKCQQNKPKSFWSLIIQCLFWEACQIRIPLFDVAICEKANVRVCGIRCPCVSEVVTSVGCASWVSEPLRKSMLLSRGKR